MRVALITANRKPDIGGGYTVEQELIQSVLRLANRSRHEFVIVSDHNPGELQKLISSENGKVRFIYYETPGKKHPLVKLLQNKKNYIQQKLVGENVDFLWLINATLQFESDIPYLTTVWDIQHRRQPFFPELSTNYSWVKRDRAYASSLQKAACIIAGNEVAKKEIELFYQIPSERIHIIPQMTPGFALHAGKQVSEIKSKYNLPDKYLFYPAQFWSHKNHANLLLALKSLQVKYNQFYPLVLVGSDKGNLSYINELIQQLELTEYVYILGFVPQDELVELYRNAFALTYVSLFGPENLPPLEAFALGCPVIVMDVPGIRQQLGDAALYAEPGDPESIAEQIMKLHDNTDLYDELRKKGEKRAYSWTSDDFVNSVFDILDEFQYYRQCWKN